MPIHTRTRVKRDSIFPSVNPAARNFRPLVCEIEMEIYRRKFLRATRALVKSSARRAEKTSAEREGQTDRLHIDCQRRASAIK